MLKPNKVWYALCRNTNGFYTFVKKLPTRVLRCAHWMPIVWKAYEWDYDSLLRVMSFQLTRMRDHIREHDMHTESQEIADEINRAIKLINWYYDDPIASKKMKRHEKKWGKAHMNDKAKKERFSLYEEEDVRKRMYLKRAFGVIGEKIEKWWC